MTDIDLTPIEEYAVGLAADGIESLVEDDFDEDGAFPYTEQGGADHEAACDLAQAIARGIRFNPRAALDLAAAAPKLT